MKRPYLRSLSLFLVLAASLAAAFWVHGDEDNTGTTSPPAPIHVGPVEPAIPQVPSLALAQLGCRTPEDTDIDPFPATSWYTPPPPPPPAPPPKPTAPPLPFQYIGKFEEIGGKSVTYLAKGNESFAISPGDKFDNDVYQFEGIEQGQMLIVYLPLSIKQRLFIGAPE